METIIVSDLLNGQTTISKNNNKVWETLSNIMASKGENDTVLFDFKGMDLIEPWANIEFQTFIKDERVYMKMYSSEKEANTINQLCKIAGVKSGRCYNEGIYVEARPSSEEKKLKRYITRFKTNTEIVDGLLVFDYIYDCVSEKIVIDALKRIIDEQSDLKGVILKFGYAEVHGTMFKPLSDFYLELKSKYDTVEFEFEDVDARGKLNTLITTHAASEMTEGERIKLFEKLVKKDQVGVLTLYKKGRKDALGRSGEGEIVFTRPAIFRGFKQNDRKIVVVFEAYRGDRFYTKLDYKLDNGGHELGELVPEKYEFSINEIGVFDKMRGESAHFNNPITLNKSEKKKVYREKKETGELTTELKTLSEFMKLVLDDNNIQYNKEELDRCIKANNDYLDKK